MGGQLALNQLLVTMDGIDNPPFMRARLHEQDQLVPRRDLHRPAARRQDWGRVFGLVVAMALGASCSSNSIVYLVGGDPLDVRADAEL